MCSTEAINQNPISIIYVDFQCSSTSDFDPTIPVTSLRPRLLLADFKKARTSEKPLPEGAAKAKAQSRSKAKAKAKASANKDEHAS